MKYCSKGHAKTEENTYKDGRCKICTRAKNALWAKNNPEKKRTIESRRDKKKTYENKKKWVQNNPERQKLAHKEWRDRNKNKLKNIAREYYLSNKDRVLARNRAWRNSNTSKNLAYCRKYQLSKLKRTPKWLTKEHLIQIYEMYNTAALLTQIIGEQYHVDHIVPLQGKTVSGLHVPWNLQILTESENRAKGNFYV